MTDLPPKVTAPVMTHDPITTPEAMREAAAPCPFCGATNPRLDIGLMEFTDGEVSCECGGNSGNHPTAAEAIAAWNRRALPIAAAPADASPKATPERNNVSDLGDIPADLYVTGAVTDGIVYETRGNVQRSVCAWP